MLSELQNRSARSAPLNLTNCARRAPPDLTNCARSAPTGCKTARIGSSSRPTFPATKRRATRGPLQRGALRTRACGDRWLHDLPEHVRTPVATSGCSGSARSWLWWLSATARRRTSVIARVRRALCRSCVSQTAHQRAQGVWLGRRSAAQLCHSHMVPAVPRLA